MVREYNFLIEKTDVEIQSVLQNHAVPRIRMYLLSSRNPDGQYVFYTSVGDLADSSAAQQAETLVDLVMEEDIVKASFQRIAAQFAASWLVQSDYSILTSQRDMAVELEKQAMADLKHLIKSDIITQAASTARTSLVVALSQVFYFANDYDPNTVDIEAKVAVAYTGAQEAGKITAIINGYAVEADIDIGDTAAVVVNKLAMAVNAAQSSNLVNVSAGPSEGPYGAATRDYYYTDGVTGLEQVSKTNYNTNLSSLRLVPWKYDLIVDWVVVTVYITHTVGLTQEPGCTGLIYGISTNPAQLTKKGPYSVAIDLNTGKTTTISSGSTTTQPLSDSFYFQGTSTADELLEYKVNDHPTRIIEVPAGTTSLDLCNLIAFDLAQVGRTQRLLAAVRPALALSINGQPSTAPALTPVSFLSESVYSRLILNILKVPTGIVFGVVPNTLVTAANADNLSKSVIVGTNVGTGSGSKSTPDIVDQSQPKDDQFGSLLSRHVPTSALQAILDDSRANNL